MDSIKTWLINSDPVLELRTKTELLDEELKTNTIQAIQKKIINDPRIKKYLEVLNNWPLKSLEKNSDASHPLYLLSFLSECKLDNKQKPIEKLSEKIFAHRNSEGFFIFQHRTNKRSTKNESDLFRKWILCEQPIVLNALISFGYKNDSRIRELIPRLYEMGSKNGWCCFNDPFLGLFNEKTPEEIEHPHCPYANILTLRIMGRFPEYHKKENVINGIQALKHQWDQKDSIKPHLFGMGPDFAKLKFPHVWFDILHIVETLSLYPHMHKDDFFLSLLKNIKETISPDRRFFAGSVYRPWKKWDFGQKRNPSSWITFKVYNILRRTDNL